MNTYLGTFFRLDFACTDAGVRKALEVWGALPDYVIGPEFDEEQVCIEGIVDADDFESFESWLQEHTEKNA